MAQSLHIGFIFGPFIDLPFGICAIYFDLKVNVWHVAVFVSWNVALGLCVCV